MKKRTLGWAALLGLGAASALACGGYGAEDGREVLADLLRQRRELLAFGAPEAKRLAELEAAIDAVAGQKDASYSELYWYRDREAARAAALAGDRPIVTLRLLGDLSCDRSCANSRFFRAALYANARVSALLRERAVLHWESVRPVPTLTIDLGDGRRIERTITGNSVHYVTLPDGQVVDVLPGLYGPAAFEEELARALDAAVTIWALPAEARPAFLRRHHLQVAARLNARRGRLLGDGARPAGRGRRPTAAEASRLARSKMAIEAPVLQVPAEPTDETWELLARQPGHAVRAQLDARSRELARRKARAGATAPELAGVLARFEHRMAVDTLKNDLLLRPRALAKLADEAPGLDALNDWVYADLFLTPKDDPWLGLDAPGEFAALEDDGLFTP